MRIVITNNMTVVQDPSPELESSLREIFSYTDNSKKFQLRRMEKNPFLKASAACAKLKAEVYGCLLMKAPSGHLVFPSGLAHYIPDYIPSEDRRCETGQDISFPWAEKPFDLRPYQKESVDLMQNNYRGLINLATGLGKTLCAIHAIREIGKKTLIVCPSKSIAHQFHVGLVKAFGKHRIGFYGDGKKKINDITVAIAASVNNNLDLFKNANLGLVIVDETHHIAATTFYSISQALGDVGKLFGLTATDFRSDGKDIMITSGCGPTLIKRDTVWGVANGWLAKPRFIVKEINTPTKEFRGDRLKNYKFHVLNCPDTASQIIADAQGYLDEGKSVLILVDEVAHGQMLSDELGLPFATGKDKKSQSYVDQLNNKEIPGLIGTDGKIGEGTDTQNVGVLILANFVLAKGAVLQAIGRGLRLFEGKTHCIIIDYKLTGCKMLTRHCNERIKYYKEITSDVEVL